MFEREKQRFQIILLPQFRIPLQLCAKHFSWLACLYKICLPCHICKGNFWQSLQFPRLRENSVFLPIFFTSCNVASSWFICLIQINQLWLSNFFRISNIVGIWIDSFDHSVRTIFKSDRNEKNFISIAFKNRTENLKSRTWKKW